MTIRDTADRMDRILQKEQPGKYRYTISQSEKQELNLENGGFKLLRTVFSNSASLRVFQDAKMGAASGKSWPQRRRPRRNPRQRIRAMISRRTREKTYFSRETRNRIWTGLLNGSRNS